MTVAVAAVVAFLVGSIPTADWVGALYGVNPRTEGTRNPGTANIVGLVGRRAGVLVLVIDVVKGAAAVIVARLLGGDAAGLVAGLAAPAGQIFNPWYGLRGGKGLAVALGGALVLWPWGAVLGLAAIAAATKATGASATGTLVALALVAALAALWGFGGLPNAWGVTAAGSLSVYGLGLALLLSPKFVSDARDLRTST